MFYKGIIFDLDNTLYNYDYTHNISINKCFNYLNNKYNIEFDLLKNVYNIVSNQLKYELNNTASSHNKSIYFKKIVEHFNLKYNNVKVLSELYWNTFYENISCYDYLKDFIVWNKEINIKIGILTDYETEYQLIKLEKLGLIEYIDNIITSEEIGVEKPSNYGYLKLLNDMKLNINDVIMIGDNYNKDILGANNLYIKSYYFNINNIDVNQYYKDLLYKFKNIYKELIQFKNICKYCGERFDLVQAGGGNISFKYDNLLFIKSSGYSLSSINEYNGYSIINNNRILEDINNDTIQNIDKYYYFSYDNRKASIETYMHSFLKKYTIHLHPIQINKLLVLKNCNDIINKLFPDSLIINYYSPGIELALNIINNYDNQNIIFLINHGVIFTTDIYDEIKYLINDTINIFESYFNDSYIYSKYKLCNVISDIINNKFKIDTITTLSNNNYKINNNNYNHIITNPDCVVYCGKEICYDIYNIQDNKPILIYYKDNLYINSFSLQKCKEIEDVLIANILITDNTTEINILSDNDINKLLKRDDEKYRINMNII